MVKTEGNHTEIEKWLKQIISNDKEMDFDGSISYMTKECLNFVTDVIDFNWGYPGSIEEVTLKKKWSEKFDLKYTNYGHLFELSDGGWTIKIFSNINYLGQLKMVSGFN